MLLSPWGNSVFRSRFMTELTSEVRKGTDTELISPHFSFQSIDSKTLFLLRSVDWDLPFAVAPLVLFGVSTGCWIEDS